LHQRFLDQSQDAYSVLSLNEASWQILREQRAVTMAETPKPDQARGRDAAATPAGGHELFERLRKLRKQLADAQGLPPYVIFHDATLREMVERRPQTLDQFAGIRGVGEGKLARYGQQFIAALSEAPTTLTPGVNEWAEGHQKY
jgi:ATP-dependent DNA helicase RecQ